MTNYASANVSVSGGGSADVGVLVCAPVQVTNNDLYLSTFTINNVTYGASDFTYRLERYLSEGGSLRFIGVSLPANSTLSWTCIYIGDGKVTLTKTYTGTLTTTTDNTVIDVINDYENASQNY